jgi:hypothetical protein
MLQTDTQNHERQKIEQGAKLFLKMKPAKKEPTLLVAKPEAKNDTHSTLRTKYDNSMFALCFDGVTKGKAPYFSLAQNG